jgi:hypothetical protein
MKSCRSCRGNDCKTSWRTLASVVGADRSSVVISFLDTVKSGLQRNLMERELYLRASGLDYTIVRAPILRAHRLAKRMSALLQQLIS